LPKISHQQKYPTEKNNINKQHPESMSSGPIPAPISLKSRLFEEPAPSLPLYRSLYENQASSFLTAKRIFS
jgi:hypothetical protein